MKQVIFLILFTIVFAQKGLHQPGHDGENLIDFDSIYDDVERLENDAEFVNYKLHFIPDIEGGSFVCDEVITIVVRRETMFLELHGIDLEWKEIELKDKSGQVNSLKEEKYNDASSTFRFTFVNPIKPGEYTVTIKFNGKISDGFDGLYRTTYNDNGVEKYLAVTQNEPIGARKIFFSADDPMYKSTFDISAIIPSSMIALSNGKESYLKIDESRKLVKFETSPKMSTYLMALVIGEFDVEETTGNNRKTQIRVFATPGQKERTSFAVTFADETLKYFTTYFGIDYPLPKLDLVAIPNFAAGAMENWGCMVFRETALLVDPENSSFKNKMRVAEVIAHEIAHQWFGNLVTMNWWSDLWLKEGFATWAAHLAIDHVYPDWHIWNEFVSQYVFSAFALDSQSSSHAVQVKVTKTSQISEIYDQISYNKGAALIHMLANYLGENTFRQCLVKYLYDYQYSSTKTKDLWDVIEEVSNKDISEMMHFWTNTRGFPIVSIDPIGRYGAFLLSQKPFYYLPPAEITESKDLIQESKYRRLYAALEENERQTLYAVRSLNVYDLKDKIDHMLSSMTQKIFHKFEDNKLLTSIIQEFLFDKGPIQQEQNVVMNLWKIPLSLTTYSKNIETPMFSKSDIMFDKPVTRVDTTKKMPYLVAGNGNRTGFYRVKLTSPELIERINQQVLLLPTLTRLGIENDAFALFYAGHLTSFQFGHILRGFLSEYDKTVTTDMVDNLNFLTSVFSNVDHNTTELWNEWIRGFFYEYAEFITWDKQQKFGKVEKEVIDIQRAEIFRLLALSGHDEYITEGKKRFSTIFKGGNKRVDMRETIYAIGIAFGGLEEFTTLKNHYLESSLAEEKVRCLSAMGEARSADIINEVIEFALSGNVRPQDFHVVFRSLGTHKQGREIAWQFLQNNYETVQTKVSHDPWLFSRILLSVAGSFASVERHEELESFIKINKIENLDRTIEVIKEKILLNHAFLTRSLYPLDLFFKWQKADHETRMANTHVYKDEEDLARQMEELYTDKTVPKTAEKLL